MPVEPSRNLVRRKLRDCFPNSHIAAESQAILDSYGARPWHRECERVQLAILKQCNGDLAQLRQLVGLANRDYRDALVGAEFPEEFAASSKTNADELAAIRKRDRAQYEAWLKCGGA